MSKTSGNCIWLDDTPGDMYGKVMSLADTQIAEYWTNLTDLDPKKLTSLKPLDAKKELAFEIVKIYHSENEAQKAKEQFESLFQKGQAPEEIPTIKITQPSVELADFLVENNLAPSKSEAKRLIKEGAIEIDGQPIKESEIELENNQMMRIGKKKFVRILL